MRIPGSKATPAPPVGPALAQHGLNIPDFCKKFNDLTKDKAGTIVSVEMIVYEDRTYDFKLKKPPVSDFIKKELGIEKGSGEPNKKKIGKITKAQIRKIAEQKMEDFNTDDITKAMKMVEGTAKNMGLEIE